MLLSIGKRIFQIGLVDPEVIPYNLTNSQTLPLYNNSIDKCVYQFLNFLTIFRFDWDKNCAN